MKKYLLVCLVLTSMGCTHQKVDCNYAYDVIPADDRIPFPVMEDYAMKCKVGEEPQRASAHR